ncbi:hypothetical protein KBC89_00890 [Candidatus Woesebacteria bacterium]|nr:hypothetical protein [Candidatus Woesebacteria bacterium]
MLQNIHESLILEQRQMRPELEALFETIKRLLLVLETSSNQIDIPSIPEISDGNWTETVLRELLDLRSEDSERFLANARLGYSSCALGVPTYLDIENPELRKHVLAKELIADISWWHPISMTQINNFVLNLARTAHSPESEVGMLSNLMRREAYRSNQPKLDQGDAASIPKFEFEKTLSVSELLVILYKAIADRWKKIELIQKMFPTKKGDIYIRRTGEMSPEEAASLERFIRITQTGQKNEIVMEFNLWEVLDHRLSIAVMELDSIAQRISQARPMELILDLLKFAKEQPIDREITSILRSLYYYDDNYPPMEKLLHHEFELRSAGNSEGRNERNTLDIRPDLYLEIPGGMTMGPDSLAGLVMQEKDYFALNSRIKLRDAVQSELKSVGKVSLLGVTLSRHKHDHLTADGCLPKWLINALGFDEIRIDNETLVPESWAKNEVKMVAKYRDQVRKIVSGSVSRSSLSSIEAYFFSNYQMPRPYYQQDDLAHIMSNWSEEQKLSERSFGIIGG